MDWLTRTVLRLLGWRPTLGKDGKGDLYEGWVRGYSYFHVYHERKGLHKVTRP